MSDLANLRNIAFVGHPSAGKTSLADAFAHALGAVERKGSVADKTSICDTEPEEQEKQHTLQLAAVHAAKDGHRWNLIDTPGYPEFVADVVSAIFATELCVGVVSCSSGVTFNLRQKMKWAAEMARGRAIVITHLDGENADFDQTVNALRNRIGQECVPVMLPDKSGHGFSAVQPPDAEWRKRLCDRVMDACDDEAVVMEYLESEELSDDVLHQHMPQAILAGKLIPVLVCNPVNGVGLAETIHWLREYAPSPETHPAYAVGGEPLALRTDGEPLGVVVNVRSDPHVGKLLMVRMINGRLRASDAVGPGKGEKLGGLFHAVGGKRRDTVDAVGAGEIVVLSKVEHLAWGASFGLAGKDVPQVDYPSRPVPMVAIAVAPKSRNDEQKIGPALSKLCDEDPSLTLEHSALTHEHIVRGMSDLHLQVLEARLKRRFGVEITHSIPRIAYRETVTKPADGHHRHKKQSGGRGQFGECYIRVRPGPEETGVEFIDKVVGGAIPRNLIPAVEKGIREVAAEGILTHSKVVGVEVELYDGKFHAVDSDEASFKKAGRNAFRDAFTKAGPVLLEPVMSVEIRIPSQDAGAIFSDLTSHRRGHVVDQSSEADGAITVIRASVPLATMQTYHRDLKSQTAGEGGYSMKLEHYARVPASEQQKILAEFGKKHEEE